jgi:hypothetical protein
LVQRPRWELLQESPGLFHWPVQLLLVVCALFAHDVHHNHMDLQDTLRQHCQIVQPGQDEGYPEYQSKQTRVIEACSPEHLFVAQIDRHPQLRLQDEAWGRSSQPYRVGNKHDDWLTMDLNIQHGMHDRKLIL